MNTKDIRTSTDPDLAGSYAAMERAARSAKDLAIKTNTGIVVAVDGKNVELTAADLIKLRDQEEHQSSRYANHFDQERVLPWMTFKKSPLPYAR